MFSVVVAEARVLVGGVNDAEREGLDEGLEEGSRGGGAPSICTT